MTWLKNQPFNISKVLPSPVTEEKPKITMYSKDTVGKGRG